MSHRIAQFLHSPQCAVNQRRISATELFFAFGNVAFPDARSKSKGTNQKGQRLCFFSRGVGRELRIPRAARFEHGVEDDQELAHAGGQHHLEGFASGLQSVGEGFDHGIETTGGQGGHVEDVPHRGTAPKDRTFPPELAAVVIVQIKGVGTHCVLK